MLKGLQSLCATHEPRLFVLFVVRYEALRYALTF
jgi:hypothetical protein